MTHRTDTDPRRLHAAQPDGADGLALQLRALGVEPPVREHPFASPARRWRLDLAWPDRLLGVEVQGGTWTRGRHSRGAGQQADADKLSAAAILGWRVLVVTTGDVRSGVAAEAVRWALEERDGLPPCLASPRSRTGL